MKILAMALGIVGSILGAIFGFAAFAAGLMEAFLAALFPLGLAAMAMSLAGIVGAVLAMFRRRPSWILMGIAGPVIVAIVSVAAALHDSHAVLWLWNISGLSLIAGSILEFFSDKTPTRA